MTVVKAVVHVRRKVAPPPSVRWELIETNWQLPCGCINADIWNSAEAEQAYCASCGRGWWHMGRRAGYCVMFDGKPQGEPVFILTDRMAA